MIDQLNEWNQIEVIHCPELKCKGMLLTNPYHHENKCSDCGKYFLFDGKFIQTELHSPVIRGKK